MPILAANRGSREACTDIPHNDADAWQISAVRILYDPG